jgi:1,4-alpha-glucan branching enzyme
MTKGAVEGLWMVTLPLDAGSYQYAFVIDGSTWVADPAAPVALEDEFGAPSSIVRIQGGRS